MPKSSLPIEDRHVPSRIDPNAKRSRSPRLIVGIVAGLLVAAYAALCLYVNALDTVFPNTVVQLAVQANGTPLDVDVSGMTQEQAAAVCVAPDWQTVELWRDEELLASPKLAQLGISIDAEATAQKALRAFRSDNILQDTFSYLQHLFGTHCVLPVYTVDDAVLAAATEEMRLSVANEVVNGSYELLEGEGLYITKPRDGRQIDAAALYEVIQSGVLANEVGRFACPFIEVDGEPINAESLHAQLSGAVQESYCDKQTGKPTPSRIGVSFSAAEVQAQLDAAEPGSRFLADAKVTFPKASEEFLKEAMFRDVLGTATTKVTGTWARINNVKLSAQAINGKIYNPGQEFWYNYTVGERTEAKGYGGAPSYAGGKTIDSIGGGICQTSSTLYLAQLNANLKTVLRYCHQFVPAYILWGCDATVSWGGCDYAFRNNTDYPIKIVTEWSDNNELTVSILGTKTDDTYVEMTNQVLSSTPWDTQYVINYEMAPGSEPEEVQTPYTGYYVKAYRNVYAGDGTLLSSVLESTSDYESRDRIYEVDPQTYEDMFGPPVAEVIQ